MAPESSSLRALRRHTRGLLLLTTWTAVSAFLMSAAATATLTLLATSERPMRRDLVDLLVLRIPRVLPADVLALATGALVLTHRQVRRRSTGPTSVGLLATTTLMAAPAWALVGLRWQAQAPVSPIEAVWGCAVLAQWSWLLARTALDPDWAWPKRRQPTPSPSPSAPTSP